MSLRIQEPLFLLSAQTGLSVGDLAAGSSVANPEINKPQPALKTGEPIPIVFCRRRNSNGGVLIQPKMSEGSFANPIVEDTYTNDSGSTFTKFPNQVAQIKYLLVLSEGNLPLLQIRDLFHGNSRRGTYNQKYNGRAGTWDPGNTIDDHFDYVVEKDGSGVFDFNPSTLTNGQSARLGNTVYYRNTDGVLYTDIEYIEQTFPAFCGNSGTYSGLTTLSFEYEQKEAAADKMDRKISAFIRSGLQVTRLVDSVTGESDNYADLVKYLFQANNRLADDLIDDTALTVAANFTDANGFLFNGVITESQNLLDWLQSTCVNFLLRTSNSEGKFGLVPRLPYNTDYTIKTTKVTPEFTFTEEHVLDDGFEISYISLEDREPVCFVVQWRQQPDADFGLVRTVEVKYAGEATNGPFVSIDMSNYCTSENHAVKVGAYNLAQRKFVTHHLRLAVRERSYNASLVVGDLVRVRLRRETSEGNVEHHDKLYEINRIEKQFQGVISYDLTHFPINSQGQSIVALEVDGAVGEGNIIDVGKSTFDADENSATATTTVGTAFGGGGSNQPPTEDTEVEIPQPGASDVDSSYPDPPNNPEDPLEDQPEESGYVQGNPVIGGYTTGSIAAGDTLTYAPGCAGAFIEWYSIDGDGVASLIGSGIGATLAVTQAMLDSKLSVYGLGKCPDSSSTTGYGPPISSDTIILDNDIKACGPSGGASQVVTPSSTPRFLEATVDIGTVFPATFTLYLTSIGGYSVFTVSGSASYNSGLFSGSSAAFTLTKTSSSRYVTIRAEFEDTNVTTIGFAAHCAS